MSVDADAASRNLAKVLAEYHGHFTDAIAGIESLPDRRWYAQLILNRLLLIYDLQVAGFLGQGDRWYLHTLLGHSQAQQTDSFLTHCLQPLCHQGLGLPPNERPRPIQETLGPVPFLGGRLLQPHWLEQTYPDAHLPDEPFELFLGWLAEQAWQRTIHGETPPDALTRDTLAAALEYLITGRTGKPILTAPQTLETICQQTVDRYLLQAVHPTPSGAGHTVESLLKNLDDPTCDRLVSEVLPKMTVLDPACGSGRLLLMALARLQQVVHACWDYAQRSPHPTLLAWTQSVRAAGTSPVWTLTRRIATQNLYGVDLRPDAVEIVQLQLWLALLSTAQTVDEVAPLPDLDFNIASGNALVGFIRVDEESFDEISPKRSRQSTPTETVLQGNLLQPLLAATYQDTLTEKQIRVEHYRAQTRAMGEADGIPEYAQTEFLRDRIEAVNQAVQAKLNRLLLETFSQKLGIRLEEPQPSGRTRKRPLTLEDIESLTPFHWGFFVNTVIEQQGGFDVIVTQPPSGTLRPNADDFYTWHADLFQQANIDRADFRRSRRLILKQHPQLAKLWSIYAGRIACLRQYIRRSHDYALGTGAMSGRSISLKTLFSQRCAALSSPTGVPPYVLED